MKSPKTQIESEEKTKDKAAGSFNINRLGRRRELNKQDWERETRVDEFKTRE